MRRIRLLNTARAAEILRISSKAVLKRISAGKLRAVEIEAQEGARRVLAIPFTARLKPADLYAEDAVQLAGLPKRKDETGALMTPDELRRRLTGAAAGDEILVSEQPRVVVFVSQELGATIRMTREDGRVYESDWPSGGMMLGLIARTALAATADSWAYDGDDGDDWVEIPTLF